MALRVLITHERFPSDFGGGGEYIVLRTAQGLLARGVDVRVLTTGTPELTQFGGVPTERLATSRYGFNLQARAIARAARQADLVHTFTYHACLPSLLAARGTGKPIVCGMLALFGQAWRAMRGPLAGRALQALEHVMVTRRYDRALFLSAPSRQQAIAMGADADRAIVLPPGIDHARLPQPDRTAPIVLFNGKMETRKGIEHVFNAAHRQTSNWWNPRATTVSWPICGARRSSSSRPIARPSASSSPRRWPPVPRWFPASTPSASPARTSRRVTSPR